MQPEGAVGLAIGERKITEQVLGRQVRVGDCSKQVIVDGIEQCQPADGLEPAGIDLVEHLLPQVLGGGLTAGDGDQLGEGRPADRGQQLRGHTAFHGEPAQLVVVEGQIGLAQLDHLVAQPETGHR